MIIERTHYYAKANQNDAVLALRRRACDVRVAIGLPAGTIRVKADAGADGPDVAWECAFPSKQAHQADLDARAASLDFEAVRAGMRGAIKRFERLFEERVAGAGGWAGDIDVGALNHVPTVHDFSSGPHQLKGFLFTPPGDGPFPCMLYNHGSGLVEGHEDNATPGIAVLLKSWGIACFYPHRRGYGFSHGPNWRSECPAPEFSPEYNAQLVKRLGAESDDVLAAFEYVRTLPAIDAARIGVMGSSFGGVNTLLAAAREARFRCAVEFAGAAMNWDRNTTIAAIWWSRPNGSACRSSLRRRPTISRCGRRRRSPRRWLARPCNSKQKFTRPSGTPSTKGTSWPDAGRKCGGLTYGDSWRSTCD